VYVTVDDAAPASAEDADYFLKWLGRINEVAASHPDYNSDAERDAVLAHITRARTFYEACRQR
jgi:hypothetical protein